MACLQRLAGTDPDAINLQTVVLGPDPRFCNSLIDLFSIAATGLHRVNGLPVKMVAVLFYRM